MQKRILYRITAASDDPEGIKIVIDGPEGANLESLHKQFYAEYDYPKEGDRKDTFYMRMATSWEKMQADGLGRPTTSDVVQCFVNWLITKHNFRNIDPIDYVYKF